MAIDIYSEEKSPCLDCEHIDRDKRHNDCVCCTRRIEYVGARDTVSNVAKDIVQKVRKPTPQKPVVQKTLKAQIKPQPETVKIKICSTCKKPKVLESGFHRASDKSDGYRSVCIDCCRKSKDKRYYNRRSGFLIDFSEHKDVFDMVVEIAENQERDVHQQLIFIVKDWMQKQASQ